MKKRRVVVTGAGTISPLGSDETSLLHSLKASKNRIRYMHEWDSYSDLDTRLACPVDDFTLPKTYTKRKTRSMGRVSQMAARASELALESAGLSGDPIVTSGNMGVSFGSATGSSAAAMEFFALLEHNTTERMNSTTYLRMMSHTAAVNISVHFGTTGRIYTTNSACTAGSQGIGYAFEAISSGSQELMIAGGAEELCPTQAAVFDVVHATSSQNDQPSRSPRPFDKNRDGLVIGEGACSLILESLEHAQARNANILAEVVAYATNSDGAHVVKPQQKTMEAVIKKSLEQANIDPKKIGYVCAHGTATEHGDIAESHATKNVLGSRPISSLKSYIGHSLGACGAIEAWLSILMMREDWFAPTVNLESIDPRCADLDFIRGEGRAINTDYVMSNNFAFGGINSSLIFKRFTQ